MSFGNPQIISSAGSMNVTPEPVPSVPGRKIPTAYAGTPLSLGDSQFGLALNGVTDDGPAFNALPPSRNLWLPDNATMFFATPITVPAYTKLQVGVGAQLLCGVNNAGTAPGIALDNGAGIYGSINGSEITAKAALLLASVGNVSSLATNLHQDGTQEYAYLENLHIATAAGSVCNDAVLFASLFFNSGMRNCVVVPATAQHALRVIGTPASNCGQLSFDRCWFQGTLSDVVVVDTPAGAHVQQDVWFSKCMFQGPPQGGSMLSIGPSNYAYSVIVRDSHFEQIVAATELTTAINIINAFAFKADHCSIVCDAGSGNVQFVQIVSPSAYNTAIVLDHLSTSQGAAMTMLNDQKKGIVVSGTYLDQYRNTGATPSIPVAGGVGFTTAGWGNYGNGYAPAHYYIDANGLLHLGGTVQTTNGSATDGIQIFTLPAGYRPATAHTIGATRSDTGTTVCKITIGSNGAVNATTSSALPAGAIINIEDGVINLAV